MNRNEWEAAVEAKYAGAAIFADYHGAFALISCEPTAANGWSNRHRVAHYDRMVGAFVY